uniref:Fringe-like glycosyltransferase domain-containing protein n=1 Tax=Ciona savignyi TaxID=51511 RepID=H2ZF15_CIOSA
RVKYILNTWFNQAKKQTYFITDRESLELNKTTNGHAVKTSCRKRRGHSDLSCKTGLSFDLYVKSDKRWWCHVDDDNYVNVQLLVKLLEKLDWRKDVYLGRQSVPHQLRGTYEGKRTRFVFASTGAGVCISKTLSKKMAPWTGNGKFLETSRIIGRPDDITLGFIINGLLKVTLTSTDLFHSHLETLAKIEPTTLQKQAILSQKAPTNVLNISKNVTNTTVFNLEEDPSRFYSLHCIIHPESQLCNAKWLH